MKEKSFVDPQLWQACAGSLVQIPPINSHVFYFPQGHAEHSQSPVSFPPDCSELPAAVLCRVAAVDFLADQDSDEVFSKLTFVPISSQSEEKVFDGRSLMEKENKPASFAKTLTQSDANNGGGFSVPRYCAETIFPRLDYSADPPVQTVVAKDVHGEVWKFRHIYRGTPRRHLLTTGWSSFVNRKKLVAGDSIVFLRSEFGELCVGIRRAKRGVAGGVGAEKLCQSGWGINSNSWSAGGIFSPYGGVSIKRNGSGDSGVGGRREGPAAPVKVTAEEVLEAARSAAEGRSFTVLYYPRGGSPEFYVKASLVKESMRIHWSCGMRFKIPFETEDSSRISWFNGTVASAQVSDPIRWPNSPWRLLQVTWDEPDLLQNVRRVSPWLVELVSSIPMIQPPPLPFSPPSKKSRFDFALEEGRFQLPCYTSNNSTLAYSSGSCYYNTAAGIQGARHFLQIGASLSDLRFNQYPNFEQQFVVNPQCSSNESVSCLLTIGGSSSSTSEKKKEKKEFLLFGQVILTEQQVEVNRSSESVSQGSSSESDNESNRTAGYCCKVFIESEDAGRTIDLTAFASYEDLYTRLVDMFGMDRALMLNRVLYRTAAGAVKRIGDEPFSVFSRTASRLTILMSPDHNVGRTWMGVMDHNVEIGLEGSNKRGALSIFA